MTISSSTDTQEKVLVIGIGNESENDDGVGVYIARRLRKLNLPHIKAIEHSGANSRLADLWRGKPNVIVLDATACGEVPGTIFRFDTKKQQLPTKLFHYAQQDVSLPESIDLSRAASTLPNRLIVYGIEGVNYSKGTELSPVLKKTAEYVLDLVIEEVTRIANSKVHTP